MMGRQTGDQSQFFYLFNLGNGIPPRHLLRWINPIVTRVLAELREKLEPHAFLRWPVSQVLLAELRRIHPAAPAASGGSGRRVGFTPTGKRRLSTAHPQVH